MKAVESRLQGEERLHVCETRGKRGEIITRELQSERGEASEDIEEPAITVKRARTPIKRPETPIKSNETSIRSPEVSVKRAEISVKRPETPPKIAISSVERPSTPPKLLDSPGLLSPNQPSASTPQSSFSPDLPLQRASLNDRIVRLERLQLLPKPHTALSSDRALSLSDLDAAKDLKSYLPDEAASVVVDNLLQKSRQTGSQDSLKAGFFPVHRSLSPLSGSFLSLAGGNEEETQGPSSELREYLREKGFRFPERRK